MRIAQNKALSAQFGASMKLSVLDLGIVSEGNDAIATIRGMRQTASSAEKFGYARYWIAEHHLTSGLAAASTPLLMQSVAHATSTIRVGSAVLQLGHRTPLSVVEDAATLSALFPGRIDIGLGRASAMPVQRGMYVDVGARAGRHEHAFTTPEGMRVPKAGTSLSGEPDALRLRYHMSLLNSRIGGSARSFEEFLDETWALRSNSYVSPHGHTFTASPSNCDGVEWWIMGATGGLSATLAGALGLRFAASYHHSPVTVLEAVRAYRQAFRPSADVPEPYVSVSASVMCASTTREALELAKNYGHWIADARRGAAKPYPSDNVARRQLTRAEALAVRDRTATQIVGSPDEVAGRLSTLACATQCDEIAVTVVCHEIEDRIRTLELVAGRIGSAPRRSSADRKRARFSPFR